MFDRKMSQVAKEATYIKGQCRWCKQDVHRFSKKRRTFCSDECVHEFLIRADPAYVRKELYKRDKGICALCGLDTSKFFSGLKKALRGSTDRKKTQESWFRDHGVPLTPCGHRSTFWDADHIQPVAEGGGLCGLENYRTLCLPCHLNETHKLKERMTNGFYGYVAFSEGIPRYVGVGPWKHWEHVNSGQSHNQALDLLVRSGQQLEIEVFPLGTWDQCQSWEIDRIREYGRMDLQTGTLFNLTNGGDGEEINRGESGSMENPIG